METIENNEVDATNPGTERPDGGGWPASGWCRAVRILGVGLLFVSVASLGITVVPVATTFDIPLVNVVGYPSLQAATRGVVIGLVLVGNGELATQVVATGRGIRKAVADVFSQ